MPRAAPREQRQVSQRHVSRPPQRSSTELAGPTELPVQTAAEFGASVAGLFSAVESAILECMALDELNVDDSLRSVTAHYLLWLGRLTMKYGENYANWAAALEEDTFPPTGPRSSAKFRRRPALLAAAQRLHEALHRCWSSGASSYRRGAQHHIWSHNTHAPRPVVASTGDSSAGGVSSASAWVSEWMSARLPLRESSATGEEGKALETATAPVSRKPPANPWRRDEDERLAELVREAKRADQIAGTQSGREQSWVNIAGEIAGRTPAQCKQRWNNKKAKLMGRRAVQKKGRKPQEASRAGRGGSGPPPAWQADFRELLRAAASQAEPIEPPEDAVEAAAILAAASTGAASTGRRLHLAGQGRGQDMGRARGRGRGRGRGLEPEGASSSSCSAGAPSASAPAAQQEAAAVLATAFSMALMAASSEGVFSAPMPPEQSPVEDPIPHHPSKTIFKKKHVSTGKPRGRPPKGKTWDDTIKVYVSKAHVSTSAEVLVRDARGFAATAEMHVDSLLL